MKAHWFLFTVLSAVAVWTAQESTARAEDTEEYVEADGGPPRRSRQLSGWYLASDFGIVTLRDDVARAEGVSAAPGFTLNVRAGAEFLDQFILGVGINYLQLPDNKPITKELHDCTGLVAEPTCSSDTSPHTSTLDGGGFTIETGYQYRFRVSEWNTWTPGVLVGYELGGPAARHINHCTDCVPVPVAGLAGPYVVGFLRATISDAFGVILRSEWPLTGGVMQRALIGVEVGYP